MRRDRQTRRKSELKIIADLATPADGLSQIAFARRWEFVPGHRVTIGEVVDVFLVKKSISKTAEHFRLAEAMVRQVLFYEAACSRGDRVREVLMRAEGGAWTADKVAERLGVKRATVLRLRRQRKLLAWTEARQLYFPRWQFRRDKPLSGLANVLPELNKDTWAEILFFLSARKSLRGQRPLDLLRKGKLDQVVQLARKHALPY